MLSYKSTHFEIYGLQKVEINMKLIKKNNITLAEDILSFLKPKDFYSKGKIDAISHCKFYRFLITN